MGGAGLPEERQKNLELASREQFPNLGATPERRHPEGRDAREPSSQQGYREPTWEGRVPGESPRRDGRGVRRNEYRRMDRDPYRSEYRGHYGYYDDDYARDQEESMNQGRFYGRSKGPHPEDMESFDEHYRVPQYRSSESESNFREHYGDYHSYKGPSRFEGRLQNRGLVATTQDLLLEE
eukprot:jgi/Picre1/32342/NNA_007688.t1